MKTKSVTLHVDLRVWKLIRIQAIKESVSLQQIVSEGLAAWVKYLRQIEVEEAREENRERKILELQEAVDVLEAVKGGRNGKVS